MSSKSELSNSLTDVRKYIKIISNLPYVSKIYLVGSRSPLSKKEAKEHSDWDFKVLSSLDSLRLPHPRRDLKLIHADIVMLYNEESIKTERKAVEIYPEDKYKILEDEKMWL